MRGRKPKPTHMLEGNYSRAELARRQSLDGDAVVECDPPVKLHASALALWRRILPQFQKVGSVRQSDLLALCITCQTFDESQRAYLEIQKSSDPEAREILFRRWLKLSDAFRRWAVEFGMTPSSRVRLVAPETQADSLEAILDRAEADAKGKFPN